MQIFSSRFTPNATGDEISLNKGEKVKYQLLNGSVIDVIIDSERMSHKNCPNLGYEAITLDNNERNFIDGKRIVWWDGKMNSMDELNRASANER
jgi:hypothetical protein